MNVSPSLRRQQWLDACCAALVKRFAEHGYTVPNNIRFSVGFPKGGGGRAKTIGQCWAAEASADGHFEIFVSPELGNGVEIFETKAHELVHATVGLDAGHKAPFKRCAEKIGLTGKMTATTGTEEFKRWAAQEIERIGVFPGAKLSMVGRRKQSTRMLKCECSDCGYVARITRKWLAGAGAPICPTDHIRMICEAVEGDDA